MGRRVARRQYTGPFFAGDTVTLSYAHEEVLRFLLACFGVGALLGFITGLLKERR